MTFSEIPKSVPILLLACGSRAAQPPLPQPEPTPGGPCITTEHRGTCGLVGIDETPAPMAGEVLVVARYRLISAEPPSADGGPTLIVHQVRASPADVDAVREHLWRHAEVPCRYWGMTGSCAVPDPVVEVPPFVPRVASQTLRPAWPVRICSVPTSGVPSAIRVVGCNCGERVECRVRTVGDRAELEVREDTATSTRCRDCVSSETVCPILRPLAAGRATVRLNGLVDLNLETTEAGLLVEGRCWDVPAQPSAPR